MWEEKRISVIIPTYAERSSVRQVVEDFFKTGVVDEVIVIDNNAEPGTDDEVAKTSARLVHEHRQGYGYAIQRGLAEALGDILVICEADGTFVARDIHKLLAYADDFDVVLGTRTTKELIWEGANMGFLLRWGNFIVAKFLEFIFNTSLLTDMGMHPEIDQPRRL